MLATYEREMNSVMGQLEEMRENLDGTRWGGRQLLMVGQLEAMRENLDGTRWGEGSCWWWGSWRRCERAWTAPGGGEGSCWWWGSWRQCERTWTAPGGGDAQETGRHLLLGGGLRRETDGHECITGEGIEWLADQLPIRRDEPTAWAQCPKPGPVPSFPDP